MAKKLPTNLPDIIRKTRKKYNLEHEDLAYLLQVSPITMIRWETGEGKPTGDNRKRLEFWISLADDHRIEEIIFNILKAQDGTLALGGFFGALNGIAGMMDRTRIGVLEGTVAPEGTLMKAFREFHLKGRYL